MRVQWPVQFDQWVRRLQAKSCEGHSYSRRQLELVTERLKRLRDVDHVVTYDTRRGGSAPLFGLSVLSPVSTPS